MLYNNSWQQNVQGTRLFVNSGRRPKPPLANGLPDRLAKHPAFGEFAVKMQQPIAKAMKLMLAVPQHQSKYYDFKYCSCMFSWQQPVIVNCWSEYESLVC